MFKKLKTHYKIAFCFVVFIAAFMGLLLSPHHKIFENGLNSLVQTTFVAIIEGVFIITALGVVGCNMKMIRGSRIDFYVNLFISVFIGCAFAGFLVYFVWRIVVGRWVIGITVSFCLLVIGLVSELYLRMGGGKVKIFSDDPEYINHRLSKFSGIAVESLFDIVKIDSSFCDLISLNSKFGLLEDVYLIPGAKCWNAEKNKFFFSGSAVCNSITSFERMMEIEFGIFPLESFGDRAWWQIDTKMRDSNLMFVKRLFDVAVAVVFGLACVPIVVCVGLIIKITDGGPVFYTQKRVGLYGNLFDIVKLRTMSLDSEVNGAQWARKDDSRVTGLGKYLRLSRIDEIPQLWNVLRGDMSFIGPRPERPEFYPKILADVPQFWFRNICKPGLTGWAQVNYKYGASVYDARIKFAFDMYYIRHWGILLEARILVRTVLAMVKGSR